MVYKPLSDARHQPLGAAPKPASTGDDEVADLPVGVFFTARQRGGAPDEAEGLFYKDGTGNVRRVRFGGQGTFAFTALDAGAAFASLGEVLFVPEVDPRAWTAARDAARRPEPELLRLARGAFFTALGSTDTPQTQRYGVYRLGKDGMIRRLLKNQSQGLYWSNAIPADRFGHFGQVLSVSED